MIIRESSDIYDKITLLTQVIIQFRSDIKGVCLDCQKVQEWAILDPRIFKTVEKLVTQLLKGLVSLSDIKPTRV